MSTFFIEYLWLILTVSVWMTSGDEGVRYQWRNPLDLEPGNTIRIRTRVANDRYQWWVDFKSGNDVAFSFKPQYQSSKFSSSRVIENSRIGGTMGPEKRVTAQDVAWPFPPLDAFFGVKFTYTPSKWEVSVESSYESNEWNRIPAYDFENRMTGHITAIATMNTYNSDLDIRIFSGQGPAPAPAPQQGGDCTIMEGGRLEMEMVEIEATQHLVIEFDIDISERPSDWIVIFSVGDDTLWLGPDGSWAVNYDYPDIDVVPAESGVDRRYKVFVEITPNQFMLMVGDQEDVSGGRDLGEGNISIQFPQSGGTFTIEDLCLRRN